MPAPAFPPFARFENLHLQVKAVDAARHTFAGLATTPELDRQGHSVDPAGVTFRNPVPLLLFHDQERPIGWVTLGAPTEAGIPFEAAMPLVAESGRLRERIDEAWQLITTGVLRGVSIGFRVLNNAVQQLKGGGLRLLQTEVVELSLVTVPANPHAAILLVKSLAASGLPPAAAPGSPRSYGTAMQTQTTAEQIQSFEARRAAQAGQMVALMTAAGESGVTLDAPQTEQYDNLAAEVKSIDDHLARLRALEGLQMQAAAPPPPSPFALAAPRPLPVVQVKSMLPPGTAFVRGCIALLRANGNRHEAAEIAKQWQDSTPEVQLWLKAAVAPGSTTDPAWAGVLAQVQNITGEFIELLRPATILGKIPNLRRVPFLVSVPVQTAGGSYGWVGQGAPKKVTKLGFGTASLPITKAAGIIVLTEELVRSSSPSAEAVVRADMIAGIAAFLDQQFIDPAVAAVANVSPASITNGTTAIPSTGNALSDIHALISALSAANIPLAGVTLIMSETNAFTLGMVRDAQGNRVFPNMSATGGTADGINVITSNTAGTNVIALQPQYILYADDGGVQIDMSREASVQMDDAPVAPDATTVLTSLWQNNLVGLRAERFINWLRGKLEAVKYVSGATYTPLLATQGSGALVGGSAEPAGRRGAVSKHEG